MYNVHVKLGLKIQFDYCLLSSVTPFLFSLCTHTNLLLLQKLKSNVGLNVAQAKTDSLGVKEIETLIDKDIPQVIPCTPVHDC